MLNLANLLTGLRILAAPFLYLAILHQYSITALILCFLGGLTDLLDGMAARKFKQESRFGELFDPLADKIMMIAIYLAFFHTGVLSIFEVGLILGRDFLILAGAIYVLVSKPKIPLDPLFLSKLNTVLQICLAGWLVLYSSLALNTHTFTKCLIYVTLSVTVISGFQYAKRFITHLCH